MPVADVAVMDIRYHPFPTLVIVDVSGDDPALVITPVDKLTCIERALLTQKLDVPNANSIDVRSPAFAYIDHVYC